MRDNDELPDIGFDELLARMTALGVKRLLVKELAPNDNSKNQPYLSGSLDVANILPIGAVEATVSRQGNRILKARLPMKWLQPDGTAAPAPHAKLILYPQYPEVRFSGFLLGATNAPSSVLTTRAPGRLLFFGIADDGTIIAWACGVGSKVAQAYQKLPSLETEGVFRIVPLAGPGDSRARLMRELKRIHDKGWIESKALRQDGTLVPCTAPQCIGYTLEAELGVARNGRSEPDFDGWEIKASQVPHLGQVIRQRILTLMTPEPTGGFYRSDGAESFVRRFGYSDLRGRPDRLNFGGRFLAGKREPRTGLTLRVRGFDAANSRVNDADGAILLVTDAAEVAAEWSFARLLAHWNKKHSRAAYVPGEKRDEPSKAYRYGETVELGVGTDVGMLIAAVANGAVYYDPGIKVEAASTLKPTIKKRSQFRVSSKNLPSLYREFSECLLS